jgi:calcineurin-like phosphoesterase family protein/2'-5' RNA ligase
MVDSYLIEIRLLGKAKSETRDLIYQTSRDYHISISRPVPHITLVGGFSTNDEAKLIRDFESISRRYRLIRYVIEGIDSFTDTGVVYLDVQPSEELITYRRELRDKLQKYCSLCEYDFKEPFEFHSTIAMHLSREEADKIKNGTEHDKRYSHRMLRATLLKNRKILAEYDFCLRKMLDRRKALSKQVLSDTFGKCTSEQKPQQVFITSDLHLGHANIIKYCDRPFKDVYDMNRTLIYNWNSTISKNDVVYFLGDLVYGRNSSTDDWLHKLNGKITFIKGNHDKSNSVEMLDHFIVEFDGIKFYLTHNPANVPETWNGWVIHGHVHNNSHDYDMKQRYPYINYNKKTVNVSVELTNYNPLKLSTIVKQIKEGERVSKELKPEKHAENIFIRIAKLVASKLRGCLKIQIICTIG